jgi:hypothetical protein
LPGRIPVGWDEQKGAFTPVKKLRLGGNETDCIAVAAFLPPGYIRTLLPAAQRDSKAPILPLWAYSSVGWKEGKFWATGLLEELLKVRSAMALNYDETVLEAFVLREKHRLRLNREMIRLDKRLLQEQALQIEADAIAQRRKEQKEQAAQADAPPST